MNYAKLAAFNGHGEPIEILEREIPKLGDGEILIRNLYTTICGSDLHTYCGLRHEKVPTVLGHEIVGEIVSFSDKHSQQDHLGNLLEIGDRVTWSIFSSDPDSAMSKLGMPQKGDKLFKYGHAQITPEDSLHGGLSTHCILKPGTSVLKVNMEVPLSVAAIINCAVATVSGALRLAGDMKNKNILITGSGLLGMVCSAMCNAYGAKAIHMADINAARLTMAQEFGATDVHLLSAGSSALPQSIDIAFDMSGSVEAMENSLASLAIGGTAIWIGAVFKTRKLQLDPESIIRKLISIKGLHNYNYDDFISAVKFINHHHDDYPFKDVVAKEFNLFQADEAFTYAVEHKPLRVGINLVDLKMNS